MTDTLEAIASFEHGESQANMTHHNHMPQLSIHQWFKEKLCDFVYTAHSTDGRKEKFAELPKTHSWTR